MTKSIRNWSPAGVFFFAILLIVLWIRFYGVDIEKPVEPFAREEQTARTLLSGGEVTVLDYLDFRESLKCCDNGRFIQHLRERGVDVNAVEELVEKKGFVSTWRQ